MRGQIGQLDLGGPTRRATGASAGLTLTGAVLGISFLRSRNSGLYTVWQLFIFRCLVSFILLHHGAAMMTPGRSMAAAEVPGQYG